MIKPAANFLMLVALILTMLPTRASQATPLADINFPQTGVTLLDAHGFLGYWQAHGGLAQFGYPIAPETAEVSPTDGRTYITQWFERNRFEYHPENADPAYKVLLGLLGRDLTRGRENEDRFKPAAKPGGTACLYFEQTGHSLCNSFRVYWEKNGGLALYGYPLSEELQEKNPTDGKTYIVQYFERNRFEYHPENKGSPYEVLLGLLGTQLGGFPLKPIPTADTPTTLQIPGQFQQLEHWSTPYTLTGPKGMHVNLFGVGETLRMMAIAPNGDLFVSSTRTGEILVMPDRDGNGVADKTLTFADDLPKPHGLAFHNGFLYVACEGRVVRFHYTAGQQTTTEDPQKLADLPSGPGVGLAGDVNHDTRSITFGADNKMYVSIGSDCDLCEETEPRRASIMQFNDDGANGKVFASGLRNAVGLDIDPKTGLLWASVNERNGKGSEIPPDFLTPIRSGGNYGWPYCYNIPLQPDPQYGKPAAFCTAKDSAAVGLPAHTAPLGIRFTNASAQLPASFNYGILSTGHGTAQATETMPTLREPEVGYDISFTSLRPTQMAQGPHTFITGWLVDHKYWGRPVDVIFAQDGALLISDDAAGAIYRVTFDK